MSSPEERSGVQGGLDAPGRGQPTVWGALRQPLFRALWVAAVASNVGTWMQNVAAAWLMTDIARTAAPVALVQTATYLPMFLIGLLAGALADIADRRRMLLATQALMAAAALGLGLLALLGAVTPAVLLAFTFVIGLGTAIMLPAWQAVIPDIVPSETLPSAVALNAASVNIARATGPALAGFIVAVTSPAIVFVLNAASFLGLMAVLYRWQLRRREPRIPRERVLGAVRAGGRYVRHSPSLRAALVRAMTFTVFASAVWTLLPILAEGRLGLGAFGFGALMGCLGAGALLAAALLPRIRHRFSIDMQVVVATVVFALMLGGLAFLDSLLLVALILVPGGFAWLTVLSHLTTAMMTLAPAWVRARALGTYLLVFQGSMALGAAEWGFVADRSGEDTALIAAAVGLIVLLPITVRWRVGRMQYLDLSPAERPEVKPAWDPDFDQGPVMVLVEYIVQPGRAEEFLTTIRELERIRRRDGATRWGVFRDAADAARYLEYFSVGSWAEYLRQRERLTVSDIEVQERVTSFHSRDEPPRVGRFIDPTGSPSPAVALRSKPV